MDRWMRSWPDGWRTDRRWAQGSRLEKSPERPGKHSEEAGPSLPQRCSPQAPKHSPQAQPSVPLSLPAWGCERPCGPGPACECPVALEPFVPKKMPEVLSGQNREGRWWGCRERGPGCGPALTPSSRPLPSPGGPGSHTHTWRSTLRARAPEQMAQRQEAVAQPGAGLQAQLGGGSWRHRDWNR